MITATVSYLDTHARMSGCVLIVLMLLAACADIRPATQPGEAQHGAASASEHQREFLVIAHRGASGYRPEHTLEAYQLAIDQGADFIEPDLVPTLDGVLIARHENALAVAKLTENGEIARGNDGQPVILAATTDVAEREEFAHLLSVRNIDGRAVAGWFSEDFTWAQIQTLQARERIPQLRAHNTSYTNLRVPSLQMVIDLLQKPGNRHVGMYPELKHPTYFLRGSRMRERANPAIDIDTAKLLVEKLQSTGFTAAHRLFIQCFEVGPLLRLHEELLPNAGLTLPLVQLFGSMRSTPADLLPQYGHASGEPSVYNYAALQGQLKPGSTFRDLVAALAATGANHLAGVGPRKTDTEFVARNLAAPGLQVHPYTVRAEPFFLSPLRGGMGNTVAAELTRLRELGATGVFIDQPDLAVAWRQHAAQRNAPEP